MCQALLPRTRIMFPFLAVRGGQNLLRLGRLRLRPGTMHVAIGKPIPTEGLREEDAKALTVRAQQAVQELYASLPRS